MFARQIFVVVMAIVLFQNLATAIPAANTIQKRSSTKTTTSSPTASATVYNTFTYDATFDDLVNSDPVEGTQAVNVYDSIFYQAFGLDTLLINPPVTGVIPNSGNQRGIFGTGLQATQGQTEMTVNYETSTIKFFHLFSFYYACESATAQGQDSLPVACTMTLVAYDINGEQLASQAFTYNPTGQLAQMSYGQLSSAFQTQQVYTITFATAGSSVDAIVGLVDSVYYTVFASGGISGNS